MRIIHTDAVEMGTEGGRKYARTNFTEMLAEPVEAYSHRESINKTYISKHGDKVDVQLLIQHEILDINANTYNGGQ